MSIKPGTVSPWFRNLPLSDPRCNNDSCIAFQAAHNASQAAVSYTLQFEYGHWTTWYYLAIIGIGMLLHLARKLRDYRAEPYPRAVSPSPTILNRAQAARRLLTYRRLNGRWIGRFGLPSLGITVFLFGTFILAVIATFAVQPYYREHRGFGSPPIAVRTGLMAVACTPILVALSGKANIITFLTGIGHEKLNVIHRGVAWICLFLSTVHTIPFLIAPSNDGGLAGLRVEFYKPGGLEYTGVPPYAILFGIVVLSIPWIRHRAYEIFWHLHVILALLYIALMFWHANQEGDSWAYLWTTLAILFCSVLVRIFHYNQPLNVHNEWLRGMPATLIALPGGMTRITLMAPPEFCWRPAQHCFIRIPSIRPWDNHPFTIGSAARTHPVGKDRTFNDVVFLARTRAGFTRALDTLVSKDPDASAEVWLDGPYGGIDYCPERVYEELILIAGGGGISACMPWLQRGISTLLDNPEGNLKRIVLLWMIRHKSHLAWMQSELEAVVAHNLQDRVVIRVHVTDEKLRDRTAESDESVQHRTNNLQNDLPKSTEREDAIESVREAQDKKTLPAPLESQIDIASGRPVLGQLIPEMWNHKSTMVLACGPESLKIDASNTCAVAQRQVLRGFAHELKFHSETFGW